MKLVADTIKSFNPYPRNTEHAGHIQLKQESTIPATPNALDNLNDVRRIESLDESSDRITALSDMAVRAAPRGVASEFLQEARNLLGGTEKLYGQQSQYVRSTTRLIVGSKPLHQKIQSTRDGLKVRIADAQAHLDKETRIRNDMQQMQQKMIETAEHDHAERPPELSIANLKNLEKELLQMIVLASSKRIEEAMLSALFKKNYSQSENWRSEWAAVTKTDPLKETHARLRKIRELSSTYFAARNHALNLTQANSGKLADLDKLALHADSLDSQQEMQPVIERIRNFSKQARKSVHDDINDDIDSLHKHRHDNFLTREIFERIDRNIENLAPRDKTSAIRYAEQMKTLESVFSSPS